MIETRVYDEGGPRDPEDSETVFDLQGARTAHAQPANECDGGPPLFDLMASSTPEESLPEESLLDDPACEVFDLLDAWPSELGAAEADGQEEQEALVDPEEREAAESIAIQLAEEDQEGLEQERLEEEVLAATALFALEDVQAVQAADDDYALQTPEDSVDVEPEPEADGGPDGRSHPLLNGPEEPTSSDMRDASNDLFTASSFNAGFNAWSHSLYGKS